MNLRDIDANPTTAVCLSRRPLLFACAVLALVGFVPDNSIGAPLQIISFPGSVDSGLVNHDGGSLFGVTTFDQIHFDVFQYGVLNGSYTLLDLPGSFNDVDNGIIVGDYGPVLNHGYSYNVATLEFKSIDRPGALSTHARAISGSNIVGSYIIAVQGIGFVYDGVQFSDIIPAGAIRSSMTGIDGASVIGNYGDATHGGAFLYDLTTGNYTKLDPPGAIRSEAAVIHGGTVMGWYDLPGSTSAFQRTFFYDIGTSTFTFPDLPGRGEDFSGNYVTGNYFADGFVSQGVYRYDLRTGEYTVLYDPLGSSAEFMYGDLVGGSLTNIDRTGVGYLWNGESFAYIVPEPSSISLVVAGAGILIGSLRFFDRNGRLRKMRQIAPQRLAT